MGIEVPLFGYMLFNVDKFDLSLSSLLMFSTFVSLLFLPTQLIIDPNISMLNFRCLSSSLLIFDKINVKNNFDLSLHPM